MQTNIVNDFLVYVIEEYKTGNYPALHTMGGRAIADDINLFVGR
jgi:hypothetical protein